MVTNMRATESYCIVVLFPVHGLGLRVQGPGLGSSIEGVGFRLGVQGLMIQGLTGFIKLLL